MAEKPNSEPFQREGSVLLEQLAGEGRLARDADEFEREVVGKSGVGEGDLPASDIDTLDVEVRETVGLPPASDMSRFDEEDGEDGQCP